MIERVCIVGAGVIGSLYAAHLARVTDVCVLTRREDHARALNEAGLQISGKHEFTARVRASADPAELGDVDLAIVATKATQLEEAAARLAGRFPRATLMTIQNGSAPRRFCAGTATWQLVSAVTFMSGVRRSDTHVEYELDTATWMGPYAGTDTPVERVEEVRGAARRIRARGGSVPRPPAGPVVEAHLQRDGEHGRARSPGSAHVGLFAREQEPTDLGHLVHELMDEGKRVAAAAGIALHEDPWEMNVLAVQRGETLKSDYAHVPSMLEDVLRGVQPRSTSSPGRSCARRHGSVCRRRCTPPCTSS